ncbi:ATP-binding cassette, subfamily B [Ruminococcus sp. YE71]|uniref:ABC transporter ATP-binding protein n=1 Tax=unclassified Ruminococcus TaxID=2608920 RepID=UPI00088669C4|nr:MULTISPECIES: ABC transporter ATP-binding protein [unclassified Ruminococcus]SDA10358.1 ATP-binding cassette, subfamily B [Ruminococcus sp. YE78]SFW10783.1 ATP-binding cassette, subfamily B [Ruminococcus sp. YE71]
MFQLQWLWHNLKGYRAVYITALVLSLGCNALYLTTPYFGSKIVDDYLTGEHAAENLANDRDGLVTMLILMIGFTLLRVVFQYACNMTYEVSSQGMIYRMRTHLFRKIETQDMDFYDKHRTGDLMTRLTGDLDMVRHTVSWVFKGIVESLSLFTAAMVFFFTISWKLALMLLAVTPCIFIVTKRFRKVARPVFVELREKLSKMNTDAQENISGNRVVKAFAREDFEIEKFRQANSDFSTANKNGSLIWLRFSPLMETFAGMLTVIMLLGGGAFIIGEQMTPGEYIAMSGLIWAVSNPMRQLGMYVNDLQRFMASAMKIIEIYYAQPRILDRADAIDCTDRLKGRVEFRNVTFRYGNKTVLENISFTAEPGETVAIMGETGSGKTTLVNLIPRFCDADEGEVLVDGVNVRFRKLRQLRHNIGMATQDVLLYSDTIDGNIAFGNSSMPEEDVKKYAKLAAADGFVSSMADGYETLIGERGVGLSGGQKQRISLARALAIRPSILILDDTTSAVDMETEAHIQQSLRDLDFPCTKIIIAQRISSTKDADKIIILGGGKIIESGTHEELLAKKGYYYDVFTLQNEGFGKGDE